jgi:hypothetical protein
VSVCDTSSPPTTAKAERPASFGSSPPTRRDRECADECRHSGHHDWPESKQAGVEDRVGRGRSLAPALFDRDIDHHDPVLLDESHEHDHADERIDVQVASEEHQGKERAEAGGGKPGKNGQGWMKFSYRMPSTT